MSLTSPLQRLRVLIAVSNIFKSKKFQINLTPYSLSDIVWSRDSTSGMCYQPVTLVTVTLVTLVLVMKLAMPRISLS